MDVFSWLFHGVKTDDILEEGIGNEILEFDMYNYHLGEANGNSNRGWLRIML